MLPQFSTLEFLHKYKATHQWLHKITLDKLNSNTNKTHSQLLHCYQTILNYNDDDDNDDASNNNNNNNNLLIYSTSIFSSRCCSCLEVLSSCPSLLSTVLSPSLLAGGGGGGSAFGFGFVKIGFTMFSNVCKKINAKYDTLMNNVALCTYCDLTGL
jgi:hypothetical protein